MAEVFYEAITICGCIYYLLITSYQIQTWVSWLMGAKRHVITNEWLLTNEWPLVVVGNIAGIHPPPAKKGS